MSLYHELKRRNVFRVAIAYLALAWLLIEVSGTLFPAFGVPEWGVRFVVIVFALGFAPALIISWVYELTPEGLKREKEVVRDASITYLTAKRLDVFTIGLIVVALAFILADRLWLNPRHVEQMAAPVEAVTDSVQISGPELTEPQYPLKAIQQEPEEVLRLRSLVMAYHALGRVVESDAALTELIGKHEQRWLPFLERIGRSPAQLAAIEFEVKLPE